MNTSEQGSPTGATPQRAAPSARPITDSGWFWLQMFSSVALIALVVVTPKYEQRQGQLEQRFEGRERATVRSTADSTAQTTLPDPAPRAESRVRHISLLPLKGAAVAVLLFASWKLRSWRRRQRTALAAGGPST